MADIFSSEKTRLNCVLNRDIINVLRKYFIISFKRFYTFSHFHKLWQKILLRVTKWAEHRLRFTQLEQKSVCCRDRVVKNAVTEGWFTFHKRENNYSLELLFPLFGNKL